MNEHRYHVARTLRVKAQWQNEGWARRHDSAVLAWQMDHGTITRNEQMVLDAICAYSQVVALYGNDGFVREHVVIPMGIALSDLLNVNLGRLDGGTLSSFLFDLAQANGLDELL